MAYGYFKDLARRIASDKFLSDKAFILQKVLHIMDITVVGFYGLQLFW